MLRNTTQFMEKVKKSTEYRGDPWKMENYIGTGETKTKRKRKEWAIVTTVVYAYV